MHNTITKDIIETHTLLKRLLIRLIKTKNTTINVINSASEYEELKTNAQQTTNEITLNNFVVKLNFS